jgi:hypothetical protein
MHNTITQPTVCVPFFLLSSLHVTMRSLIELPCVARYDGVGLIYAYCITQNAQNA